MKNVFLSSAMPLVLPLLAGAWACQKTAQGSSDVSSGSGKMQSTVTQEAGALSLADDAAGGVKPNAGAPGSATTGWGTPVPGVAATNSGDGTGTAAKTPAAPSSNPPPIDGGAVTSNNGGGTGATPSERPNPTGVAANSNPISGEGGTTPLVLDWNRDGIITTSVAAGKGYVPFDIAARGQKRSLEWIAPSDAILCLDINGNGLIDDGRELFGSSTQIRLENGDTVTASHGFLGLAQHDVNHNGLIDAMDPVFAKLLLWQDKNHNGISESVELTRLSDTDVTALSLAYRDLPSVLGLLPKSLSFIGQTSSYMTRSGAAFEMADVYFAEQKPWSFAQSIQSK